MYLIFVASKKYVNVVLPFVEKYVYLHFTYLLNAVVKLNTIHSHFTTKIQKYQHLSILFYIYFITELYEFIFFKEMDILFIIKCNVVVLW